MTCCRAARWIRADMASRLDELNLGDRNLLAGIITAVERGQLSEESLLALREQASFSPAGYQCWG